ncbi:MAG: transposase [Pirellulales bacterium]
MAQAPKRSEQFPPNEISIAHCTQRCVRRAFLTGKDSVSGKNYEYRREWIRRRLELLAATFGIDVLNYSVMSNHVHTILRTRPDVVKAWDDEEVARRWLQLFPGERLEDFLGTPTQQDIAQAIADAKQLTNGELGCRTFLGLCEPLPNPSHDMQIEKMNALEGFGKDVLRLRRLSTEAGLLACAMYVDLNPVRTALAKSPEQSRFTSAFDRIQAKKGKRVTPASKQFWEDFLNEEQVASKLEEAIAANRRIEAEELKKQLASLRSSKKGKNRQLQMEVGSWMAPLQIDERGKPGPQASSSGVRASDKGFLNMSSDEYLTLLDWTGRHKQEGKRGAFQRT